MTLEGWNTILQFASAVLLGATFVVGAGAIWTSHRLGQIQQERIAQADRAAAEARQAAAEANEKAALLNDRAARAELQLAELDRQQGPRRLLVDQVAAALKAGPRGIAEVVWVEEVTGEPYWLAEQVAQALRQGGWAVTMTAWPASVNEWEYVAGTSRTDSRAWLDDRRPEGIQIISHSYNHEPGPAVEWLKKSFREGGIGVGLGNDGSLKDDAVRVMVGFKP